MSTNSGKSATDWNETARFVLMLAGVALMAYGAGLIRPAYGYLTGGSTLFFGLLAAQIAAQRGKRR